MRIRAHLDGGLSRLPPVLSFRSVRGCDRLDEREYGRREGRRVIIGRDSFLRNIL